jgi:hypothetical protein
MGTVLQGLIALLLAIVAIAGIRRFFRISWAWAIVIAIALVKVLSLAGIDVPGSDRATHKIQVVAQTPDQSTPQSSLFTLSAEQALREVRAKKGIEALATVQDSPLQIVDASWRRSGRRLQPPVTARLVPRETFGEILWRARVLNCAKEGLITDEVRVRLAFYDRAEFKLWERTVEVDCESEISGGVLLPESYVDQVAKVTMTADRGE